MVFGSLLTGLGGCDIGAKNAGMELAFGLEIDPALAEVANFNLGDHVRVGDILEANPKDFPKVDFLHMSPVCKRASNAAPTATESVLDISVATKLVEFIDVLEPRHISIENVIPYRNFKSFGMLINALQSNGYLFNVAHVNSADFGVPQKRRRLIMRAVKGALLPPLAEAKPWVGWYEAVGDLVEDCPDCKLAPWQLKRLERMPKEFKTMLVGSGGYNDKLVSANYSSPSMTITANHNQLQLRAILVKGQNSYGNGVIQDTDTDPAHTIGANEHGSKMLIPQEVIDVNPTYRVVRLTTRCLARLQSFPDWYKFSGNNILDAKGIGNAVPPLMMQSIYSQFMDLN